MTSTRPPLSRRIADDLTGQIRSGKLKPGDQLPSTAQLAAQYRASRVTAYRAVKLLREAGLVEGDPGRGVFVSDPADRATPDG